MSDTSASEADESLYMTPETREEFERAQQRLDELEQKVDEGLLTRLVRRLPF